ncbi:MAG: hypothetical protein OEW67_06900 [Cyclobacteriaceae bacterium]|nr:hypothetical protein [Cyclobacteriaceae bacterium]
MKRTHLVLLICLPSVCAFAQSSNDSLNINDYYIDFAVPDLSASALLGVKPDEVLKPSSVKELATDIFSFNQDGKLVPGLAIEVAPFLIRKGKVKDSIEASINQYKQQYWYRSLQLTAATATDSTGVNFAFGFKFTPIDKSNPLLNDKFRALEIQNLMAGNIENSLLLDELKDETKILVNSILDSNELASLANYVSLSNCFALDLKKHPAPIPNTNDAIIKRFISKLNSIEPDINLTSKEHKQLLEVSERYVNLVDVFSQDNDAIAKEVKARKEKWKKEQWNAQMLQLAAGFNFNSRDSTWSNLNQQKFSYYINYGHPLGKSVQMLLQLQGYNNIIDNSQENFGQQSKLFIGSRIIGGNSDKRLSFEIGYSDLKYNDKALDEKVWKWSTGVEFKIQKGLWLEIAMGGRYSSQDNFKSDPITLGKIKYAFQKERRFDIN